MDLLAGHIPKKPPNYCFTKKDYYQACQAAGSSIALRTARDEVDRRVESGEFGLWGSYKGRPYYYVKAAE